MTDPPSPNPSSAHVPQTLKTAFPQARVKTIMREDKDLSAVSHDAVFAATLATEMFLEYLVDKSFENTKKEMRKIVSYKDVARAVGDHGEMAFLEDVIPPTLSVRQALENKAKIDKQRDGVA
ncbi:uncharacterized protein SPPG_05448 [Spizellomyces punctatus DAOM BR117]|uniref:Transcription factor CBF/NF-Y/archaeal histone domain-containing protein n=1 Tax=Spizellomyces punctatus (strain DAOM BR117) TaxID=645134 RepID=A0A0L0HDI7_SPIPD|nr:uncharacterized protein SPPG_05448 [Spizellomyces punctatus DAOM BR117]KNC99192.1 hypothetical protein SPPG_05448 [Spizellomyces punctatus DAOM BR117]|eukprot:XP_016607232.1 hypothetical protein SPPG_05448 [Spizellomyces punctatus DAOM BR117]